MVFFNYQSAYINVIGKSEPLWTELNRNLTLIDRFMLRLRILWIYIPDSFIFQVKVLN